MSSGMLPGMPAQIPVTPRVGSIVLGLALCAGSLWALFSFLPAHRPLSDLEALAYVTDGALHGDFARADHWFLKPGPYLIAQISAVILALLGLSSAIRGATYRAYRQVHCAHCRRDVIGKRGTFGVSCPLGSHMAEGNFAGTGLVVLACVVALIVAAKLAT